MQSVRLQKMRQTMLNGCSKVVASCLLLLAASTEALQASRPVPCTHRAAAPASDVAMSLEPADASVDKPSAARRFPVAALALGTLGSTGLLAAGAATVGGVVGGSGFVPSFSLILLSEIGNLLLTVSP